MTAPLVRPNTAEDYSQIKEMADRNGMTIDPYEKWLSFWTDNPAMKRAPKDFPMGWVLECTGKIVGYLGNVPSLYHYQGQDLIAASTRAYVVDSESQSHGLKLALRFSQQSGVDLFLNTTANEPAGRIFQFFKFEPLQNPIVDEFLFWILRPREFGESLLRKKNCPPAMARPLSLLIAPAAYVAGWASRNSSGKRLRKDAEITVDTELGDEYDVLWGNKKQQSPQSLLAHRSGESLRWFVKTSRTQMLSYRKDGKLLGYLLLKGQAHNRLKLTRFKIVDLFVENDDEAVILELIKAAYWRAKLLSGDVLEMVGFPEQIRRVAFQLHPYKRRLPYVPFYSKSADGQSLESMRWYACPFDGDCSL